MALGCLLRVHYPPVHVLSLGMFNLCYHVVDLNETVGTIYFTLHFIYRSTCSNNITVSRLYNLYNNWLCFPDLN